jgi:hypothetical protein
MTMSKMILLVGLFAVLQGCAYKNPMFQPYVDEVIKYCDDYKCGKQQRINQISISFGDLGSDNDVGAHCGLNGIIVKKDGWCENDYTTYGCLTEIDRFMIIFHELGHCAFGKDHIEGTTYDSNGIYATSIMNPNLSNIVKGWKNKEVQKELLDEFFQ